MILGEIEYTAYKDATGAFVNAPAGGDESLTAVKVEDDEVIKGEGGALVLKVAPTIAVASRAHKMSKSRGNVVNPDDIVKSFGADAMRVYEMFMGPLEATKPWSTSSIAGVRRFLDRAFTVAQRASADAPLSDESDRLLHKTVKKVSEDIDAMRFNTAVSAMMVLSNELLKLDALPKVAAETLAVLLHP
ncbi:MAG: class I tRNA ligase family protein, partial [Polyangiaceae bacterium]|nr:class I tRNA ligase family protein [Polyangiaceae bacterium]